MSKSVKKSFLWAGIALATALLIGGIAFVAVPAQAEIGGAMVMSAAATDCGGSGGGGECIPACQP